MKRSNALICYLAIVAVVVALDLWSKSAAFSFLGATLELGTKPGEVGEPLFDPGPKGEVPVIVGWFSLQATHNRGAFSGWFGDSPVILLLVSTAAALATLVIAVWSPRPARLLVVSLGLVAGGAVGNLYDRFYFHAVRDFLKVFYTRSDGSEAVWPNFNLADSAICCGVALLFLRELLLARQARREKNTTTEPEPATAAPPAE